MPDYSGIFKKFKLNYDLASAFFEAQQAFFSPEEHDFFSSEAVVSFSSFFAPVTFATNHTD